MKDKLFIEYETMLPKLKETYNKLKVMEQEYKEKVIDKITVGKDFDKDEAILILEKLRVQYDKWNAINNGMHKIEESIIKKYGIEHNEIHTLYVASKLPCCKKTK